MREMIARRIASILVALVCVCLLASCSKPPKVVTAPGEFRELCKTCNPQDIQASIAAGADVKVRGADGWTPLMAAAAYNHDPAVVLALLKAGADINASSCDLTFQDSHGQIALIVGDSPLELAAKNNTAEVVSALVQSGAFADGENHLQQHQDRVMMQAPGCEDVSVLAIAASENENPGVIDVLVKAGAKVDSKDGNGKTALDYARSKGNSVAVAALERYGLK